MMKKKNFFYTMNSFNNLLVGNIIKRLYISFREKIIKMKCDRNN